MKFADLKSSFSNGIKNAYVLSGNDRYLCSNALEILKQKAGLQFPDLNSVVFTEDNFDESKIVEACMVLPFLDKVRLVIVKEFKGGAAPSQVMLDYLKSPVDTTVLIFFAPESSEYIKKISKYCEVVNCDVLDEKLLLSWINRFVSKRNITIGTDAMMTLVEYTSGQLTRISTELEKLSGFAGNGGTIWKRDVEALVVKDKEYQVYELNEAVASGKLDIALDMLNTLQATQKNEFFIITPMYNYFRRLLLIKTSKDTDARLANMFGIKEYAVKKMREKIRNFTAKKLKKIVDLLAKCDLNIKSGKMAGDIAVKTTMLQIIKMRNE